MTDAVETMIERVAWEICKEGWKHSTPPAPLPVVRNAFEMHKKSYLAQARAAIAAMADLTPEMIAAADARTHWASGDPIPQGDEGDGEGWFPAFHRAVIKAALSEPNT